MWSTAWQTCICSDTRPCSPCGQRRWSRAAGNFRKQDGDDMTPDHRIHRNLLIELDVATFERTEGITTSRTGGQIRVSNPGPQTLALEPGAQPWQSGPDGAKVTSSESVRDVVDVRRTLVAANDRSVQRPRRHGRQGQGRFVWHRHDDNAGRRGHARCGCYQASWCDAMDGCTGDRLAIRVARRCSGSP